MSVLRRMRGAIRTERYRISSHANDEMADDMLMASDIERIVLTGAIIRQFTDDPRGTRYEVLGKAVDGRAAYVVCRFHGPDVLLIITAYAAEVEE